MDNRSALRRCRDVPRNHRILHRLAAQKSPRAFRSMDLGLAPRPRHQRLRRRIPPWHGGSVQRHASTHAGQRYAVRDVHPPGHRRVVGHGRHLLGGRFASGGRVVHRHRNHLGTEKRRLRARHSDSHAAQTPG
ncbi:Uncharacterised protein [Candidatus Venteria ishoeyi]|uniref:Uncharacterized protein n=1 Tax=Candidatus Venteria ishoeyi TaxID=1899563 RepID=A0A1H6F8Z6_9GAMM|nr:Uncharacterised protein [Candidatus Venteria ishoeyi]